MKYININCKIYIDNLLDYFKTAIICNIILFITIIKSKIALN